MTTKIIDEAWRKLEEELPPAFTELAKAFFELGTIQGRADAYRNKYYERCNNAVDLAIEKVKWLCSLPPALFRPKIKLW
jgi:hypothetical protein